MHVRWTIDVVVFLFYVVLPISLVLFSELPVDLNFVPWKLLYLVFRLCCTREEICFKPYLFFLLFSTTGLFTTLDLHLQLSFQILH